ncbi:hypothetical protein [Thermosulfuriphilus sp.]
MMQSKVTDRAPVMFLLAGGRIMVALVGWNRQFETLQYVLEKKEHIPVECPVFLKFASSESGQALLDFDLSLLQCLKPPDFHFLLNRSQVIGFTEAKYIFPHVIQQYSLLIKQIGFLPEPPKADPPQKPTLVEKDEGKIVPLRFRREDEENEGDDG